MAKHERPGKSDEWYTPPYVFEKLSEQFDLDVASPAVDLVPWIPAYSRYQTESLTRYWSGFVWMNPPFGGRNGIVPWLQRFMDHGDGIALTPDRTSCSWWRTYAPQADAVLFVAPKIKFIPGPGVSVSSPAQGTTLFAKGDRAVAALRRASDAGLGWCP